ncbi:unnamed protein product [Amoebophrya sp. A25]|nr:unnamed protein product [Amoebophrya sp. A25]|eukprot:GSA25T00017236001.1
MLTRTRTSTVEKKTVILNKEARWPLGDKALEVLVETMLLVVKSKTTNKNNLTTTTQQMAPQTRGGCQDFRSFSRTSSLVLMLLVKLQMFLREVILDLPKDRRHTSIILKTTCLLLRILKTT